MLTPERGSYNEHGFALLQRDATTARYLRARHDAGVFRTCRT